MRRSRESGGVYPSAVLGRLLVGFVSGHLRSIEFSVFTGAHRTTFGSSRIEIVKTRLAWRARFYPEPLTLEVEVDCSRLYGLPLGRWKLMRMADLHMCMSIAHRFCVQQVSGHTEGVLAYVVYEGCWCKEHKLYDFTQPWLLRKLVRGMESMKWRRVENAIVKDWKRHYAVVAELPAVASKFCVKLVTARSNGKAVSCIVCIFGRSVLRARWPLDSGAQTRASHPTRLASAECVGEAVGFGWTNLLMVGTSLFFNSVRSKKNDMETERHTARARCALGLLPHYLRACACKYSTTAMDDAASAWDHRFKTRASP